MSKRFFIVLAVVWTAAIGLAGFSMLRPDSAADTGQQASSSGSSGGQTERQQTSQQISNERGGEDGKDGKDVREAVARSDSSASPGASSGRPDSRRLTLELGGEPGVAFSGRCVVDGQKRNVSGQTPETFTYEPDESLECEITSQDGPLQVTFSDGGSTRTTQTAGPGASTLELTYDGGGFASSTRSVSQTGSSQTSSSQTSSSQTSSSQSISQQSSSSVTQSGSE